MLILAKPITRHRCDWRVSDINFVDFVYFASAVSVGGSAAQPVSFYKTVNPRRLHADVKLAVVACVIGPHCPDHCVEGEAFAKRVLQTRVTDRGFTQILSGIAEGERVVTVGGYQVRLAALSTSVPVGRGHEH